MHREGPLELWVYLDGNGKGDLANQIPARMLAEGRRLAGMSGLRLCGVTRSITAAQDCASSGQCGEAEVIFALSDAPAYFETAAATVALDLCQAVEKRQPQMILFPATVPEAEVGARVAAQLGCAFLGRCVDLEWEEGRVVARRSVYNGSAHQLLCPLGEPPWIATIDPLILNEVPTSGTGPPAVEVLLGGLQENPVGMPPDRWRLSARELDLVDAEIVLSVGRGVQTEETLRQVYELAELLGATVGGSREAVFGGLVARHQQIGASGKWIAPRINVAFGISGSTYHMMGIRGTKHLVAVNVDPRASIFEHAEIGIVADLEEIIPALLAILQSEADKGSSNPV
jgi:electron transfer flavoprotein alpha subunit